MNQGIPIHTFQTRFGCEETVQYALQAMADLLSLVERKLFADIMAGKKVSDLKSEYLKKFQITARQFNACRVSVEGMIQSRKELQVKGIAELKHKIEVLEKKIEKLKGDHSKVYWKKKRLNRLKQKLSNLESDKSKGIVRICFGTKKMFRAQFHLEEAGYNNFDEWKEEWKQCRNNNFFLLGSKDETAGNQTCIATIQEDGKLSLRIRLPDALSSQFGKYITLPDLYFSYGHDSITYALNECNDRNVLQRSKNAGYKNYGQAISYRFHKDNKGWRVFASTSLIKPEWKTTAFQGVIGIDINADHLALSEMDHNGNPISKQSIPLNLYGKGKNQSLALIGDACAKIIDYAISKNKDVIIEKLNFQQKKTILYEIENDRYARMLSSFAYATIIQTIKSRAWRNGVQIHEVNPAFTSIIGRIKYAQRYGFTIHQAAALCIGRRFLGFSEIAPSQAKVPDGKGDHIDFLLPVRNRKTHNWSHWGVINRKLRTVLAAHFRAAQSRSTDPPKTDPRDSKIPEVVGEIPTRESLATLLG